MQITESVPAILSFYASVDILFFGLSFRPILVNMKSQEQAKENYSNLAQTFIWTHFWPREHSGSQERLEGPSLWLDFGGQGHFSMTFLSTQEFICQSQYR